MKSKLVSLSFVLSVACASHLPISARQAPEGPVAPDTTKYCTYYDLAFNKNFNCAYFEEWWGISHEDFLAWNPSVKNDCSGIVVGNSYCVEAHIPETPTSGGPTTTTPTPTPKPSPTQDGLINTCQSFYQAVKGDTCDKITKKYGTFSSADFIKWNPAVGDDCSELWIGYYYCVSIPGIPTGLPSTTVGPTPTATGKPVPSPVQDGIISSCQNYYLAVKDDTCQKIVKKFGTFTLAQFLTWNPAVDTDCSGLWLGYYYCVGIPGTPTTRPASSTPTTTTGPPPGPSPTQDGIISTCKNYYIAVKDDTCQKIVDKYGAFSLAQFLSWNPAVGSDCSGLWLGYYYCVGIPGTPTTPTKKSTSKPPTATPTSTVPTPHQDGIIATCKKYYKAVKDDTCDKVVKGQAVKDFATFLKWNPAVKSDCSGLWLGYYYCVSA